MGKSISFHLWSQMDWRPGWLSLGSRDSDSLLATRTSRKLYNSLGEKDLMSWHISLAIDPLLIYSLSLVSIYYPYRLILLTAWRFKHHFSWSKKTVFLDRPLDEESLKLAQKMKHFFFLHIDKLYMWLSMSVFDKMVELQFFNSDLAHLCEGTLRTLQRLLCLCAFSSLHLPCML